MILKRLFTSSTRQFIDVDVLIVGAGPAGLSAAIKLKQLDQSKNIVILEKASSIGAHTVSGIVFDPKALDELLPNWREMDNIPLMTRVGQEKMKLLTKSSSISLPIPKAIQNHDCYIGSLCQIVGWLGEQALNMGVEIYSGFAASSPIYDDKDKLVGIFTNDIGRRRDGTESNTFELGLGIRAKHTLVAEGAHGSLAKQIIAKYNLRKDRSHQTYGLGLKEVWKIKKEKHISGLVEHTLGWPLSSNVYGGSFMYHWGEDLVSLGLVIGLDYKNPYLNTFKEFQRLKLHKEFSNLLEGGECISYGARVINEGGWQSIPKPFFPGGALIGCSAGFLNVPRIKGTHLAMKSGMIAAEMIHQHDDLVGFEDKIKESWIGKELWQVRNIRPAFKKFNLFGGLLYSGIDLLFLKGNVPWTFSHGSPDHECLEPANASKPIIYPKPDNQLTFSLMDSVYKTGTNHRDDQPNHLVLKTFGKHETSSWPKFKGVESRFCPAGVYEYEVEVEVEAEEKDDKNNQDSVKFKINSQNCIHCKTCDIKDPLQNIDWTVPEGGGGPKYTNL